LAQPASALSNAMPVSSISSLFMTPPLELLSARHALRVDVERIHRGARRHEEPVAVQAAEAHVGAALGQIDAPDELGFAVEDVDAVERLAPHAPAHPQVAVDVEAEAVGRAAGLGLQERAALGELRAAVDHVVDLHDARRRAGLDDVEL